MRTIPKWSRWFVGVALLGLLASACGDSDDDGSTGAQSEGSASEEAAGSEFPDEGVTKDTIKIGWIGDLTGPASPTIVPLLEGSQAYFDMVNEAGGINGRKVELIPKNDEYTGPKAVAGFKELAENDKVLALAGIAGSPGVAATLNDVESTGIPVVGAAQSIFAQLAAPHYWNLAATYLDVAEVGLAYADQELGLSEPKVVTVGLDAPSGLEWGDIVKSRCEAGACEYLKHLAVPVAGTDFSAQAQEIARLEPDFVMVHGTGGTATVLLNGMAKAGVEVPTLGTFTTTVNRVWESTPASVNAKFVGMHWATPPHVVVPGTQEMLDAAKAAGVKPTSTDFVHGWVTAMVMTEAMRNAGDELNRATFEAELAKIKDFDTGGLTAPVTIDDEYHHGIRVPRPYGWDPQAKQIQPIGEYADWEDAISGDYADFVK